KGYAPARRFCKGGRPASEGATENALWCMGRLAGRMSLSAMEPERRQCARRCGIVEYRGAAELVDRLLGGLDDPAVPANGETPAVSEAWRQEGAWRSGEYDVGGGDSVSWQDVQAR